MLWLVTTSFDDKQLRIPLDSASLLQLLRFLQAAITIEEAAPNVDDRPSQLEPATVMNRIASESDSVFLWLFHLHARYNTKPIHSQEQLVSWFESHRQSLWPHLDLGGLVQRQCSSFDGKEKRDAEVWRRWFLWREFVRTEIQTLQPELFERCQAEPLLSQISEKQVQLWSRLVGISELFALAGDLPNGVEWELILFERMGLSATVSKKLDEQFMTRLRQKCSNHTEGDDKPNSLLEDKEAFDFYVESVNFYQRCFELRHNFDNALHQAKMEAMKELAYGASHEVNNPLANIATRAQTLMKDESSPEKQQRLAMISRQAFRAHEMISNMMLFAHPPALQVETVALPTIVSQVIVELSDEAGLQGTELQFECEPAAPDFEDLSPCSTSSELPAQENSPWVMMGDRTHLAVLVKELIRNSLEALGEGGKVLISLRLESTEGDNRLTELSEGRSDQTAVRKSDEMNSVLLRVIDDGPGIPDSIRKKVFDPFFSGREAGRGLGFGLSKAWRIVELHGGVIFLDDALDQTCWVAKLPLNRTLNRSDLDRPQTAP